MEIPMIELAALLVGILDDEAQTDREKIAGVRGVAYTLELVGESGDEQADEPADDQAGRPADDSRPPQCDFDTLGTFGAPGPPYTPPPGTPYTPACHSSGV